MFKLSEIALNGLASGAFLSAGGAEKCNVMTIAWGMLGIMWRKPVFMAPVRVSRYTAEFIDNDGVFCVSIPYNGSLSAELKMCGSKSGRSYDKISQLNTTKCHSIDTLAVSGCEVYYECRLLARVPLSTEMLGVSADEFYRDGDYHILYIGEIVNKH